jgi:fibrillarin-like pre-rRNA processing protein
MRLDWPAVYQGPKGVLTKNPSPGVRVYGERLIPHRDGELRAWNPRRSKLGALLLAAGRTPFPLRGDEKVLYLGAASGTTVSHVSDILQEGRVVAVEKSPRSFRDLLDLARSRNNVDPVLSDARDVDGLMAVVGGPVDLLYQDVAQRDQDVIFVNVARRFLRPGGRGMIMVKARSVSVAREPEEVYDAVSARLEAEGFAVTGRVPLEPWEKDHAAILVQRRDD